MKVYQTNEIKNVAILGNHGAGKTTLTEALLFESGIIKRRGSVDSKNTVSDYFPVEQEYGYSVFSTVFHTEWKNKKLNFIDCPGSDDFVGAAVTALNVTDSAVILINGQYGPEVGTQNHFRHTENLNKPVVFAINQLDNDKCDFDQVMDQLRTSYGGAVVPIQYPVARFLTLPGDRLVCRPGGRGPGRCRRKEQGKQMRPLVLERKRFSFAGPKPRTTG